MAPNPARDSSHTSGPSPANPITRTALRGGLFRSALPARTQAGFIAATVALVVIAFVSYQSSRIRTDGARLVAHTLEVTQHLESLLSIVKDAETGQRGYLLTAEEVYLGPYLQAVASLPGELAANRRLVSDNPEQLSRLATLEQLAQEKMAELKQTIDLRAGAEREAALKVVRSDRGRRLMDEIRRYVGEMDQAERSLLADRTQKWEQVSAFSNAATWGGSLLLLLLIAVAGNMSAGDFRAQRTQAWLRTGQGELAASLQGEQDTRELGARVASFLGRYLEAQVGAVYFAENRGPLQRVGGFALPPESEARPPGGLTTQVLESNAVIHLRDVPEDYFPVSSALGQTRPRHLLLAPISADGRPNGVIELGFLQPLMASDLDLLRRVAETIGVALRTAKYRKELENLLEETQRQAEELQTQQEELRTQNEELEQQSQALQQSQSRLENQQAELEQINARLEEQTDDLAQQRDDLAAAQGELQRANIYKSEFLANMSHELRTPLNSSLILAKLLADNRGGNMNEEQVKFAQTIYSAGNDLLTLINDILDLSKIEAGKLDVRPEDVFLARLTDDLNDTFSPIARQRNLGLTAKLEDGLPATIFTDPTRLQQILKNLLSNALKFTERGGVSLSVRRERDGRLTFEVKDTGIGIPADKHEVIFEAFRQADGTTNRKYGGTGLGLSISRDLARLLGGELTLESAPGRGSTFVLTLPERGSVAPAEQARAPSAPRRAPIKVAPAPDDRDRIKAGTRTILIIEDDDKFAGVLRDLAHELDFQVLLATSGESGLAMAEQYRPSAIVLDVGLPDRSGLSVLDTLKHRPSTRHIPVHIVSVSDYSQAALEMGAAGYAIKPVQREKLIDAFHHLEDKFTQKLRRILVVEDDEVARDSTCKLIASRDVETVAVGTAAQALEQLGSATFDCMVLDLSLPDRSGLELLEEMSRTDRAFPPVIVYTGRSLSRLEEQQLRKLSHSIIIKGARSPERLLDEVTLFLHQVESDLPPERQRMLRDARHREAVFEGKRVLVVEDDVRNIFALSSVLEPKGAKVEIARNGKEALAHLQNRPGVDLVLMDVMMPEMDGLEATREIRKRPELARLPIIALTAKAMSDDRDQCLAAGANDYIAKPLDVDKLLSLARVWMPK